MKHKRILILALFVVLLFCLTGCDSVEKQQEIMGNGDAAARVQAVQKIAELSIGNDKYNLFDELLPYLYDDTAAVRAQVLREFENAYQTYSQNPASDFTGMKAQTLRDNALQAIAAYAIRGDLDMETRKQAAAFYNGIQDGKQRSESFLNDLIPLWAQNADDDFTYSFMTDAAYAFTDDVMGYLLTKLDDAYAAFYASNSRAPKTQEFLTLMDADLCAILHQALVREKDGQEDSLYRVLLARLKPAGKFTNAKEMMVALYLLSDPAVLDAVSGEDFLPALQAILKNTASINEQTRTQLGGFIAYLMKQNQQLQDACVLAMADDMEMFKFYLNLIPYGFGNETQLFAVAAQAEGQSLRDICITLIAKKGETAGTTFFYGEIFTALNKRFPQLPEYVKEYIYLAAFYQKGRGESAYPAFDPAWSATDVIRQLFLADDASGEYLKNLMNRALSEEGRALVYDSIVQTIYAGDYTLDDYMQDSVWINGGWHELLTDYLDAQYAAREYELSQASANPTLREGANRVKIFEFHDHNSANNKEMDPAYIALLPDDARYVITFTGITVTVGVYVPTDSTLSIYSNKAFNADRMDTTLHVIDKLTGEIIREETVIGNPPPERTGATANNYHASRTIPWNEIDALIVAICQELIGTAAE